ncbi:aminotransferase class IV family protein [Hydrogenimonas cancrithermarum]|uniref:4-amino-4-deoxychorismate lyase n=1 Tax=Hydrogenimonas cancrithermarum TaxID=2993563 RepID=A0ABM8FM22_9BACT|nr:aminotransferase class IV family protein [Hydrogenimonas cancrithermarum]BDY13375.1 4-amino-4-deoxychorismate lyase [Hydrogenimonas cancrithermarum]
MLLETISIVNGSIQHLSLHQARLDRSQSALFEDYTPIDLGSLIHPPSGSGQIKCRIVYADELIDISYAPYHPREVRHLKLIESSIDYAHKYSDREALDDLFARRGGADDVLIVRNGLITDTSVANIAFYDGKKWITPKSPLLRGTTRERLVRSGFLIPRDIRVDELGNFETFALLNAMIGFEPVKHGTIT